MVDKDIPWVRFLFTGYIADSNGDISQYCFTTLNYRSHYTPYNKAWILDGCQIEVPRERLGAFISANRGAILGDLEFDDASVKRFSSRRPYDSDSSNSNGYIRNAGIEIIFYFDEDNSTLWYVDKKGNVDKTTDFVEVYAKYERILSGDAILLESEFFSPNFQTVISATEDMFEKIKLIEGRNRITGQNLSKLSVSGYDSTDGVVLVKATGLVGESRNGVNVYPEVVSEVNVSLSDIMNSDVKVFDLSRCHSLNSFKIGDISFSRIVSRESVSLVLSQSARRRAYGEFYPSAKEVRIVGTEGALFKSFILDGECVTCVTVDGEIRAECLTLVNCTGLSTLKVSASHGEDGCNSSHIMLSKLDTANLEVHNLQLGRDNRIGISDCKELKYLTLSFCELPEENHPVNLTWFIDNLSGVGLEGLTHLTMDAHDCSYFLEENENTLIDTAFPNLVELTLIGMFVNNPNIQLWYDDCRLRIPRGCKVNCDDESVRARIYSK